MLDDRRLNVVKHKVVVLLPPHLRKPVLDGNLWSARQEHAQLDALQRLQLRETLQDDLHIVLVVALVQRVDYQYIPRLAFFVL
jgi:hypothetical protein